MTFREFLEGFSYYDIPFAIKFKTEGEEESLAHIKDLECLKKPRLQALN